LKKKDNRRNETEVVCLPCCFKAILSQLKARVESKRGTQALLIRIQDVQLLFRYKMEIKLKMTIFNSSQTSVKLLYGITNGFEAAQVSLQNNQVCWVAAVLNINQRLRYII
jgi:hypothetical protein